MREWRRRDQWKARKLARGPRRLQRRGEREKADGRDGTGRRGAYLEELESVEAVAGNDDVDILAARGRQLFRSRVW